MDFREMTIADYDDIITMFKASPGITIRKADSRVATAQYLKRNPGLSFVATENKKIIGCVMCGHDGRRGYLQHLIVSANYRRQGIGRQLFMACLQVLETMGIVKTHLFVLKSNAEANQLWTNKGWTLREDINTYSYNKSANENA